MTQPVPGRERAALLDWLAGQRRHVLGVVRGLPDEALRRPVLPSGWTCLGMVRHLAVDDERFWFRGVAAGEPVDFDEATGWQPSPGEPAEAVLELCRREIAASDEVLAGLDAHRLDDDTAMLRFTDMYVFLHMAAAAQEPLPEILVEARNGAGQFAIVVDDVDAVCSELAGRAGWNCSAARRTGPGDAAATFADPGGHIWEIA